MAVEQSSLLLRKQLKGLSASIGPSFTTILELGKNPVDGFSAGLVDENNVYEVLECSRCLYANHL